MNCYKQRPNILCFITDQHRYDHLGCYGNSIVKTPNIDTIAARGVTLDRAYVSNPLCMPARATLFTGRTPRGHGVRTNGIPLCESIPTLPHALRNAGYRTHSVGKLHLHNFGIPRGNKLEDINPQLFPELEAFWNSGVTRALPKPYYGMETADVVNGHTQWVFGDYIHWMEKEHPGMKRGLLPEYALEKPTGAPQCYKMSIPEELHYNRWISDRTIQFLDENRHTSNPFFLWCSFPDPHHPYAVPKPWCNMYNPKDIPLPSARRENELDDLPQFYKKIYEEGAPIVSGLHGPAKVIDAHLREMIALTYGMISFVDNEIGRILRKLHELELERETIIVFLSDHGDMMGDHWMIRKGPFHFEGLVRIPFIWSWPGYFPEGARTSGLTGHIDFMPTILDLCGIPVPEGKVPDEPEASMMFEPLPGKSLKRQLEGKVDKINDWIIIENDEDYLGLRVRTFVTDQYKLTIYPGQPYGELFDLANDPQELKNLWVDPRYTEMIKEMKSRFLEAYIQQDSALPRRLSHA